MEVYIIENCNPYWNGQFDHPNIGAYISSHLNKEEAEEALENLDDKKFILIEKEVNFLADEENIYVLEDHREICPDGPNIGQITLFCTEDEANEEAEEYHSVWRFHNGTPQYKTEDGWRDVDIDNRIK